MRINMHRRGLLGDGREAADWGFAYTDLDVRRYPPSSAVTILRRGHGDLRMFSSPKIAERQSA
jgi:hypothetical protein